MKRVVGVRFRPCGKMYYFDPKDLELKIDDGVICDTEKGLMFGTVALPKSKLPDELVPEEVEPLLRKATEEDIRIHESRTEKERSARGIFLEKAAEHKLEMKLVSVECSFDGYRITFYFSAEGRVDFRELVKDLASELHARIELRQIGVRDETRMLGSMGTCGRPLCCSIYLKEFSPVTIKMAKSQNLSLNPTKISGLCGRLMCCLKNESEVYEELNKNLPKRGTVVTTTDGFVGVAIDSNILAQTVRVIVDMDNDEKEVREYGIEQLKFTPGIKRPVRKEDQRQVARSSVVANAAKAESKKKALQQAVERQAELEEDRNHSEIVRDEKKEEAARIESANGHSSEKKKNRRHGQKNERDFNERERVKGDERGDRDSEKSGEHRRPRRRRRRKFGERAQSDSAERQENEKNGRKTWAERARRRAEDKESRADSSDGK